MHLEEEIARLINLPLRFSKGLPDWEDELLYTLLPSAFGNPLWTLNSIVDPSHELILIQPHWLVPNYSLEVGFDDQANEILTDVPRGILLVALTILSNASDKLIVRAHLLTPLLIDLARKEGHRFLLKEFPLDYGKFSSFELIFQPAFKAKRIKESF